MFFSDLFQENGLTPLMIAAKENKLVIVERLIDLGVSPNDRAKVGRDKHLKHNVVNINLWFVVISTFHINSRFFFD